MIDAQNTHRYVTQVPTGGNAVMSIVNPMADPHIEWSLRYADNLASSRFSAASLVESYDYLLSQNINMTEATRRLRLLRAARRAVIAKATASRQPTEGDSHE